MRSVDYFPNVLKDLLSSKEKSIDIKAQNLSRPLFLYCLPCDHPLPKEELERCEEWAELAAKAKKGDPTAKKQLKAHMEYTQKYPYIKTIHVGGQELPGRTCVPSYLEKQVFGGHQAEQIDIYYKRCDDSYRNNSGRLLPKRALQDLQGGEKCAWKGRRRY
ncbi:hypothetical protein GJ744_003770 [Endocarpon pusillum]|uniref:Uncharacterized protein n=1 Tax=Endocarpon pusillum TaxID=364733 RepID=A0A8H7AP27_9EURO|nr:hypothetical protein GJ744_003770 [Endocarpon pusillum]